MTVITSSIIQDEASATGRTLILVTRFTVHVFSALHALAVLNSEPLRAFQTR